MVDWGWGRMLINDSVGMIFGVFLRSVEGLNLVWTCGAKLCCCIVGLMKGFGKAIAVLPRIYSIIFSRRCCCINN